MTLAEKYAETKPVAVMGLSNWGGLEILDIISSEEVIACFNYGSGRKSIRKHKVYDGDKHGDKPYIRKFGTRYYLDDMMRV